MAVFLDHVNACLERLRETPITALSTDTTTEAFKAQNSVRRAVKRVWNAKQWSFKLRQFSFITTASQEGYVLPKLVGEVYKLKSSGSPYDITVVNEDTFDRNIPNPTSTGNPEFARLFEMVGVETQPSSASAITVVSSNANDIGQKVLIKGLVSGQVDYEELTLNGTTNVNGSKSFSEIYAVTKSAETAGRITVTSNSGVVTNVILATQEKVVRLRKVRLYPIPSSTLTITVKSYGLHPELTNAYEDTEIPTRWDYVVDQFAFAYALQAKGKEQLEEFVAQMQLADKMLDEDMLTEETLNADQIIVPERWGGTGNGHLGWTSLPAGYGYTL